MAPAGRMGAAMKLTALLFMPVPPESRIRPGLFFAGEILDVDGITGGFNFQHAWTSGFIAGKGIANASMGV